MQRLLALALLAALAGTAAAACDSAGYDAAFTKFGDCTIRATNFQSPSIMCNCYAQYYSQANAVDCLTEKAAEIATWQTNCNNIKPPCTIDKCKYTGDISLLNTGAAASFAPVLLLSVGASLLAGLAAARFGH
mmetsp:Transcript_58178/g.142730  ORF Transcript_58178/g.142730 Transcript_58178/m.142730 type:complete len:133 (+) Transcript_58178:31-429(+)|eukprot:CAMPEP_0206240404 /NCGR_PEP_ID=MMETSP0047_2-20121206/15921_1 /ASSEMBLY_ACC=CAM_ASM_000192 /TAXON_ID=195065 /ORGANISM="Chroomonas mesostigmatica_cf, Strain CCMP1168" /LENGTH=132 /DNA_ID=CAMNT_0053665185 /DNA_START=21 /DNA_END=419 /DNA_ORIENTATION=-